MEKKQNTAPGQEKVRSRYDRKMEARRQKEEKEKKQALLAKMICAAVVVCVAAAAVIYGVTYSAKRSAALHDPYLQVGDHTVTKMEYDYYYNSIKNTYLTNYGSFLSAMGVDPGKDLAGQPYMGSDTMTWKDYFDQAAVEQMRQTKILTDDALDGGFSYDSQAADETQFWNSVESNARTAKMSSKQFIRAEFGPYADKKNITPIVRENLLAIAYQENLMEKNKPSDEEIRERYEENRKNYDSVDYRSFTFTADLAEDASEDEIRRAMEKLESDAKEMEKRRKAGEAFNTLCAEYAREDSEIDYTDDEAGLTEGAAHAGTSSSYSDWLYEEDRKAGDITIMADDIGHTYTLVEFVKRYYDEEKDAAIRDTIAGERVDAYIQDLASGYEVMDLKGELDYLKETQAETGEASDGGEAVNTDGAADSGDPEETAGSPETSGETQGDGESAAGESTAGEAR